LWAAAEARSLGRGGVGVVAKASRSSRTTVYAGLAEIEAADGVMGNGSKTASPSEPVFATAPTATPARPIIEQALGRYRSHARNGPESDRAMFASDRRIT
jgi:hypothetical protein